jgi:hypothetical protein
MSELYVAVAAWILFKVLLVIFFSRVEALKQLIFNGNRFSV